MLRQQNQKTAIYCRLSKDDGTNSESISIGTQKDMLTTYAKENGLFPVEIYVDDGYSGKNFERPDFKRMISDIEAGKISGCICKDLSRFGRNYLEVGMFTEVFFPEHDVRFIAIADGIDTARSTESLDIAPFKNILNDMFLKDISKKNLNGTSHSIQSGQIHGSFCPIWLQKRPFG